MSNELFVWRVEEESLPCPGRFGADKYTRRVLEDSEFLKTLSQYAKSATWENSGQLCKYCNSHIVSISSPMFYEDFTGDDWSRGAYCPICGWGLYEYEVDDKHGGGLNQSIKGEALLYEFDINSDHLLFEEIGRYLSDNFDKVHSLSPRRTELLFADIYKNHGYAVEVTKATRDGGKDLILFDKNGDKQIVEIKNHSSTLGVSFVRQLRGVQFTYGYKRARLIATSKFSKEARKECVAPIPRQFGFEMDLCDAEDILRMLSVYAENITLVKKVSKLLPHK